jgi:hypothetical protein
MRVRVTVSVVAPWRHGTTPPRDPSWTTCGNVARRSIGLAEGRSLRPRPRSDVELRPNRCGANIWLGFALLVPVAVGVTVGVHSPSGRVRITQSMIRGFPVTSFAAAFLVLPITVPVLRIASMLRGQYDAYVPLITTPESYPVATNVIVETLRRHGIEMRSVAPP